MIRKLIWFVCLVAFATLVAYVYSPALIGMQGDELDLFPQSAPVEPEEFIESYSLSNGGDFLSYENADYLFTIKYPIGFAAAEYPDPFTACRFTAASTLGSEIIEVKVAEESFSNQELRDALAGDLEGELDEEYELSRYEETEVNGVKAFLFEGNAGVLDFVAWVRGGFYQCDGYTALVTVTVPSVAAADFDMADYVLYSFEC